MKVGWQQYAPRQRRKEGRMAICTLAAIAGLLALSGCSMIPSPLIVGNTYTNFEYEFSLDLPEGWEAADDPVQALARYAGWVDDEMASLVLIHGPSEGVIAVFNQKKDLTFPRYIDLDERFWAHRIDEMKERLKHKVTVLDFAYWISKDNLVTTQQNYFISQRAYKPEKAFGVDALIAENQDRKRMNFEWFLFPCHRDHSCQITIMMACREDRYEETRPAFGRVVDTLRAHDYY